VKSKKKAIKDLTQSKVVNISDYRSLQKGQEGQKIALVSEDKALFEELKKLLPERIELKCLESRFALEQSLKNSEEWDAILLDERELKDEAISLCEKLKRQNKMEELVLFILSGTNEKDKVRAGLEKGCDEWISRPEDATGILRLLDHYLNLGL